MATPIMATTEELHRQNDVLYYFPFTVQSRTEVVLVDLHGQRLSYAVGTSPASYGGGFLKSAVDLHEIIPIPMIGQRSFPIDLRSCKAYCP